VSKPARWNGYETLSLVDAIDPNARYALGTRFTDRRQRSGARSGGHRATIVRVGRTFAKPRKI